MWTGSRRPGRLRRAASAADMEKLRLRSPWVPSCLGQPRVLQGRLARSSPSLWDSALQEQKGELRKRLSYTTHRLEKLETEFDSTRHYLEIELRRAQEELEKVTEKLRRIQSNYMALQRINQELEAKLYRMGQHYEEEKRALSHEIVALNSHLLEAKVTIDKLSEDNELYRKDCNLAAQLLQSSQTYGRVHKVSELPSDFAERAGLRLDTRGCGLAPPLCRPGFADSGLADALERPEPRSLSPRLSDAAARDLAFGDGAERPGAPYAGGIYRSDTALYRAAERRPERRPSADAPVTDVGFLRPHNSTDSAAEDEAEAEAGGFPAGFAGYARSLPTSSSYSSFSATSEEKEGGAAPPFPPRPQPAAFPGSPPSAAGAGPALRPGLWGLRAAPGRWRPPSVEDLGAYALPAAAGRASPCGLSERYFGGGSPEPEARGGARYAGYAADSLSEGEGGAARRGARGGAGGSPGPGRGSPHSSRDSLEPSSMDASPERRPAARPSPPPAFARTGGAGLSRKDSLTKAQLYGTLLN